MLRCLRWFLILSGVILMLLPMVQRGYAHVAQLRLAANFDHRGTGMNLALPAGATGTAVTDRSRPRGLLSAAGFVQAEAINGGNKTRRAAPHLSLSPGSDPVIAAEAGAEKPPAITGQADFAGPARLIIPAAGIDAFVGFGTSAEQLARGPGFYPEGVLPGELGNVAIAGHRTTWGAWFRHLDRLQAGDWIALDYNGRRNLYRVQRVWIVDAHDWSVIAPTEQAVLTLTTCHPPGSSRQRLVVRASLVENAIS